MGICHGLPTPHKMVWLSCWPCQDIHAGTVFNGGMQPFDSWRECNLDHLQTHRCGTLSQLTVHPYQVKNSSLVMQALCLQQTFSTSSGMCLQCPQCTTQGCCYFLHHFLDLPHEWWPSINPLLHDCWMFFQYIPARENIQRHQELLCTQNIHAVHFIQIIDYVTSNCWAFLSLAVYTVATLSNSSDGCKVQWTQFTSTL